MEIAFFSYIRVDYFPGGGGHSLIWPIRRRAARQGMVFGLSALKKETILCKPVLERVWTCPKQDM